MIDGTYLIMADTSLGKKEAMVTLTSEGDVAHADIDAPIIGKQKAAGKLKGNAFTAEGAVKVPLKKKTISYTVEGQVSDEGMLFATLKSSKGNLQLVGARL